MHRTASRPITPAFWRRIFASRDRELTDAGTAGELLVARARLGLAALILLVPLVSVTREPARAENWVGASAALGSTLVSIAVLAAVSRGWRPRWLGVATSLYDVTLVSCVLLALAVIGPPHMAINSRVTFEIYFLALGATCLRYDRRICTVAGLVAAAQYLCIVLFVALHWDLRSPAYAPFPYGMLSIPDQIGRIILLLVMTLLTVTLVDRTERLRILSTHDGLTDLYNRGYFDERFVEEMLRARRYQRPVALAIVDLDRFKDVNDQYGHMAGDAALRQFADALRDSVRRTDIVARFGGEEFALIFPETTGAGARAKLERVRATVERLPIQLPRGAGLLHLTFSAGVAASPEDGDRSDDLITRADARLLAAKQGGRNRVLGTDSPLSRSAGA